MEIGFRLVDQQYLMWWYIAVLESDCPGFYHYIMKTFSAEPKQNLKSKYKMGFSTIPRKV